MRGRPSKYTPELVAKARAYVDDWAPTEDELIPSHVSLARYLRVNTDTLYDWAKQEDKRAFSDILRDCMDLQQEVLINKGLGKVFDSGLTKLVLGKHGYHDKMDNTHSGPNGGPIKTINADMSAEEATKTYEDMMKG